MFPNGERARSHVCRDFDGNLLDHKVDRMMIQQQKQQQQLCSVEKNGSNATLHRPAGPWRAAGDRELGRKAQVQWDCCKEVHQVRVCHPYDATF